MLLLYTELRWGEGGKGGGGRGGGGKEEGGKRGVVALQ